MQLKSINKIEKGNKRRMTKKKQQQIYHEIWSRLLYNSTKKILDFSN